MDTTEKEIEMGTKAIATKIKLPKSEKEKIYTKIVKEFWMAILIFVYFVFLNLGYVQLNQKIFTEDLKIFSGMLICLTIFVFEVAYRKDSGEIAIHGIELLILGILTLFMPYIYYHRGMVYKFLYSFSAMYIAIYYSIKALIIYEIEVKKYITGLSDVKEIILEDEVSYLDESNERKFENIREFDENSDSKPDTQVKVNRKLDFIKKLNKKKNKSVNESKVVKNDSKELEKINDFDESKEDIEEKDEIPKKNIVRKKAPKKRKKKVVKSMATQRKNSKENGDNQDD